MNRENLINRLVDRKMNANCNRKAFCICMAAASKALCFAAAGEATRQPANPKS